jgi:hypothetical protein
MHAARKVAVRLPELHGSEHVPVMCDEVLGNIPIDAIQECMLPSPNLVLLANYLDIDGDRLRTRRGDFSEAVKRSPQFRDLVAQLGTGNSQDPPAVRLKRQKKLSQAEILSVALTA